jgi:uncharacterized protein (TIGR03437 family)
MAMAGFNTSAQMTVRAVDAEGRPVPNVPLKWEVVEGAGTIVNPPGATGDDGFAGAYFRGDVSPGYSIARHTIRVSSPCGDVRFGQVTGVSRLPNGSMAELPSVQIVKPPEEDRTLSGEAGSVIEKAISLRLFVVGGMQSGQGVGGVEFRIVNPDDPEGTAAAECVASAVTGDTGTASCDLRLTGEPGIYRISAKVGEARITPGIMLTIKPAVARPKPPAIHPPKVEPEPAAIEVKAITNAASFAEGGVAPGEIVTLFGANLGPAAAVGLQLDANGMVQRSLGGVSVLFDGLAAPLVYVSAGQISAVVPYGVAGKESVECSVEQDGRRSKPVRVRVAEAAPGLFAYRSGDRVFAAALNQDGSTNGPGNGAEPGSIVVFYATGEGCTEPDGVDGKVAAVSFPKPRLAVAVKFGGVPAEILYAGAAPGMTAGVMQINARLPQGFPAGSFVPVAVSVGGAVSQGDVVVAVR